ncbi:MAG TPA: DUF3298 domain-containing protein [Clostridia bacterium]|nr:DUF3298 domain-containing protein [Clostridia bacterium]
MTKIRFFSAVLIGWLLICPVQAASSLKVYGFSTEFKEPSLQYSCSYPRITGIDNNQMQQRVNVMIREKAETSVQTAQYISKKLNGAVKVSGKFHYQLKRNENGILSLVLQDSLFTGNERGIQQQTGVTLNTVNGRIYKLRSLFVEHADYVGVISDEIHRQISQKGLKNQQLESFKKIRNDENFYLTSDSLVVFFDQYQYGNSDIREFSIPLNSLNGMLKPEFRLLT